MEKRNEMKNKDKHENENQTQIKIKMRVKLEWGHSMKYEKKKAKIIQGIE